MRTLSLVCYYENACNMSRSIVSLCPWINDEFVIVCDRFQYHGHTCNSICDPNSYSSSSKHSAWVQRQLIICGLSKSYLKFLCPDYLITFLAAPAVYINVRASVREELKKSDIFGIEFRNYIKRKWKC